jgi:hypothetical protein
MKQIVVTLLAVAAAVSMASSARATTRAEFEAILKKGSTLSWERDKYACVCMDPGPFGTAGVVRRFYSGHEFVVACMMLGFDPNGDLNSEVACGDWERVGR